MAKQWAFYFEQNYCSGCCTCQIACKDKNNLKVGQNFRKVEEYSGGTYEQQGQALIPKIYAFWLSMSCNHCLKPACVAKCPTNALTKDRENGIVRLDQDKCIGCQQCIKICPYGALVYDPSVKKVGKCDFCEDLLKKGEAPACVSACPMRALEYGELEELQKRTGAKRQTYGMASGKVTEPALVVVPHRSADLLQSEAEKSPTDRKGAS